MVKGRGDAKGKRAAQGRREVEKKHEEHEENEVGGKGKKNSSKRERKTRTMSADEVTDVSVDTRRSKRVKTKEIEVEKTTTPRRRSERNAVSKEMEDGNDQNGKKNQAKKKVKTASDTPKSNTRRSMRRAAVVDLSQETVQDSDSSIEIVDDESKKEKVEKRKRKASTDKSTPRSISKKASQSDETQSTQNTTTDTENTPVQRRSARNHNPAPTYTSPSLNAMAAVAAIDSTSESSKPLQGRRVNVKSGQAKKASKAESDDEDQSNKSLFQAVKEANCSFPDLLHSWRLRFIKNPAAGSRELLNFILYSCGATSEGVEKDSDLESVDMEYLVNAIVRDLEDSKEFSYPIVSKTKILRTFKKSFAEFWEAFVIECWDSEAFIKTDIVENCIDWLATLSSSEVRAVRHTSTIAAYEISNALIDRACHIRDQMAPIVRQHAAEAKKLDGSGKKTPKFNKLVEMKTAYDAQKRKTMEALGLLFKGVVVHRYRDIMPEIRMASVEALGSWIVRMPEEYLEDKYLKYMGWMLNDKSAKVRSMVLDSLQNIYEKPDNVAKLEVFTSRFLRRYLEMCDDVDDDVVLSSIQLVSKLDRLQMLNDDCDLSVVERLVFYEEDEEISKAAAEFACLQYDAFGTSHRSLTEKQLTTQAIALIEFAEEYMNSLGELSHPMETLTKAFWDLEDCQVIQNWRLLAKLLGSDSQDPPLSSEQQTILIQLIAAVLKQLKADETNTTTKSRKTNRKKKSDEEPTSIFFCKELPHFMMRFQSDSNKICLLLQWLSLLNWNAANLHQHQKQVELLLQRLKQVYLTYSEEPFLEALSYAFNYMKESNNAALTREVETVLFAIVQESVDQCKSLLQQQKDDDDSQFSLRSWLARLSYLAGYLDLRNYVKVSDRDLLVDYLLKKQNNLSSDATLSLKYALNIVLKDLLWITTPIFEKLQDRDAQTEDDIKDIIDDILRRRKTLEDVLLALLSLHLKEPVTRNAVNAHDLLDEEAEYQSEGQWQDIQQLQIAAFIAFCDVRCLYVEKFDELAPPLNEVSYKPNNNLLVLSQSLYERSIDNEDVDESLRRDLLIALATASIWNPQNKRQAAAVVKCVTKSNLRPHAKAFGKLLNSLSPVKLLEVQMVALRHAYEDDSQSALDLAKTLSQSLGVKLPATLRGSYLKFLLEGVRTSFLSPVSDHLGFLALLKPYLYRLDKTSLKELQIYFENQRDMVEEDISSSSDILDEFYTHLNTSSLKGIAEEAPKHRSITSLSEDEEETNEAIPSSITIRSKPRRINSTPDKDSSTRVQVEPMSDDEVFDTPQSKNKNAGEDKTTKSPSTSTPSSNINQDASAHANKDDEVSKQSDSTPDLVEDSTTSHDKDNDNGSAKDISTQASSPINSEKGEELPEDNEVSKSSDEEEVTSFRAKRRRTN